MNEQSEKMTEKRVSIKVDDSVTLEGIFSTFDEYSKGVALILHPHPLYGGSMNNNVVEALFEGAKKAHWDSLRINFRGVGNSTGSYGEGILEKQDVLASAEWLRKRKEQPLAVLGYSFGTLVGSKVINKLPLLKGAVWVAPPLSMGELSPWNNDFGKLLLIAGDKDEFNTPYQLQTYQKQNGARVHYTPMRGSDHFFGKYESALKQLVCRFLEKM